VLKLKYGDLCVPEDMFVTVRRWRYYTSRHYTEIYKLLLYGCWAISNGTPKVFCGNIW